ncbi:MAG: DNA replication/repair protein RecF [Turicibacter sp.]
MFINKLSLKQFRNYESACVEFTKNINIIIGNNAQGKTSLIESIYVLSTTKSHRTSKDSQLILFDQEFARIQADVSREYDDFDLSLILSKKGKKAIYNGVDQKKLSDYVGKLVVVMFAPEDLSLVKGGPQYRRRFIDMEIGQLSPSYLFHLGQYSKLLKQRNELLKQLRFNRKDELLLEIMTEQMVPHVVFVLKERLLFIEKLQFFAQKVHSEISNQLEMITLEYTNSFKNTELVEEAILQKYRDYYDQDISQGSTGHGPHRDDFSVSINGVNTHQFGSQGQQRTASLSMKLAEIELIHSVINEYPILLLDDVLSELDDNRQTQLLNTIKNKVQTFITTTNIDGVDDNVLELADIFMIENAEIRIGDKYDS